VDGIRLIIRQLTTHSHNTKISSCSTAARQDSKTRAEAWREESFLVLHSQLTAEGVQMVEAVLKSFKHALGQNPNRPKRKPKVRPLGALLSSEPPKRPLVPIQYLLLLPNGTPTSNSHLQVHALSPPSSVCHHQSNTRPRRSQQPPRNPNQRRQPSTLNNHINNQHHPNTSTSNRK